MSYVWFNLVLEALGKRLNYESISNLYGNSFAKDSAKLIQGANPLIKTGTLRGGGIMDLASQITIIDTTKGEVDKKQLTKEISKEIGDISWIEDFM